MSVKPLATGDDLDNDDIALLCDIGQYAHSEARPARRARVASLR